MSRECYHCHQVIKKNENHDCWTTTEAALTAGLSEDLMDAWERLRESASEFGEQRIYGLASLHYVLQRGLLLLRPAEEKSTGNLFLSGPHHQVADDPENDAVIKDKVAHLVHVTHRDQVESPLTNWLREAFETSGKLSGKGRA